MSGADQAITPVFVVGAWQRNGKVRKMQQSELLPVEVRRKHGNVRAVMNPNRTMSFIVLAVITSERNLVPVADWYEIPPRGWLELHPAAGNFTISGAAFRGSEMGRASAVS